MADVTRLRPKAKTTEHGRDDPTRRALAEAIKEAELARQMVAKQKAAIDKLRVDAREAEAAVEAAQKAVQRAQEAHVGALVDAAALDKPTPDSGVAAARQAAIAATDHFDALKAARRKLEADIPDWERDARKADVEVEALISMILVPQAEALLVKAEEVAAKLKPLRATLAALWSEITPAGHEDALAHVQSRRPIQPTKEKVSAFLERTSAFTRAAPDPWLLARVELRVNAYAELPPITSLKD